jgi:hypothetical protein
MMAGDSATGLSIMRVTPGLDSGPVALQEEVAIGPDEDWGSLSGRLAELGGELLVRALDLHESGELSFEEQDDSLATYAEKIGPEDRRLDPARPARELAATVRALTPHVGAYLELEGGERLGELLFAEGRQAAWLPLSGAALADGAGLLVADGEEPGLLRVEHVRTNLPRGVGFQLTHPDWAKPTECELELTPRRGGALLNVKHVGWQAISRQKDYQKSQRRRFAALWISALRRARRLTEESLDA